MLALRRDGKYLPGTIAILELQRETRHGQRQRRQQDACRRAHAHTHETGHVLVCGAAHGSHKGCEVNCLIHPRRPWLRPHCAATREKGKFTLTMASVIMSCFRVSNRVFPRGIGVAAAYLVGGVGGRALGLGDRGGSALGLGLDLLGRHGD